MQYTLPAEFKERWITALVSGRYAQGYGWLHVGSRFCCLGVAYEVCGGEWVQKGFTQGDKPLYETKSGFGSYLTQNDVPLEVFAVLDQLVPDPAGHEGATMSLQRKLSDMNDSVSTFRDIAEYIKREL